MIATDRGIEWRTLNTGKLVDAGMVPLACRECADRIFDAIMKGKHHDQQTQTHAAGATESEQTVRRP